MFRGLFCRLQTDGMTDHTNQKQKQTKFLLVFKTKNKNF